MSAFREHPIGRSGCGGRRQIGVSHTHGSKNEYKPFITEYLPLSETVKSTSDEETWSGSLRARAIDKGNTKISLPDGFVQMSLQRKNCILYRFQTSLKIDDGEDSLELGGFCINF